MLILVTVITIIVLGIAWYVAYKYDYKKLDRGWYNSDELKPRNCWHNEIQTSIAIVLSVIFGIIFVIHICFACMDWIPKIAEGNVIEHKIEMYEKENTKIESDIEKIVEQYYKHEKITFDMSEINSATTLVQMYPELKSDKLVLKQIEIYKENNDEIKKLKIDQIDCQKAKWWLYFGSIDLEDDKGDINNGTE